MVLPCGDTNHSLSELGPTRPDLSPHSRANSKWHNYVFQLGHVVLCHAVLTYAEECEGLRLVGLMTIGAPDYSGCRTEDFETLKRCRAEAIAE